MREEEEEPFPSGGGRERERERAAITWEVKPAVSAVIANIQVTDF